MRFAVAMISAGRLHSQCVREVAETLHYGLLALGHESVLTNHLNLDDHHTIVLQPHFLSHHGLKPPKHPILYNFEQAYLHSNCMNALSCSPFSDATRFGTTAKPTSSGSSIERKCLHPSTFRSDTSPR